MALLSRKKRAAEAAAVLDHSSEQLRRPTTVGGVLREAREARGLDVERAGAVLRIRPAYLQAIEEDRYDRLPGAAYALGFVRAYAEFVGLDGAEIARRYKQEATGLEPRPDLSFPVALPERSRPGGAIFLVAVILAGCGYGLWYYVSSGERSRPERVAAVPTQLLPPPPAAPSPAVPPAAEPPAAETSTAAEATGSLAPSSAGETITVSTVPPESASAPPAISSMAAMPSAPSQTTAAAAPASSAVSPPSSVASTAAIPEPPAAAAPAEGPRVYGLANGQTRVQIKANADSWVQVQENNQSIWQRILKPGEIYRVPDRPGLSLVTGNAGALEITVDGKTVPPIGPAGKRRTVSLDPDRLVRGSAGAAPAASPNTAAPATATTTPAPASNTTFE